jgi:hypothetical protein
VNPHYRILVPSYLNISSRSSAVKHSASARSVSHHFCFPPNAPYPPGVCTFSRGFDLSSFSHELDVHAQVTMPPPPTFRAPFDPTRFGCMCSVPPLLGSERFYGCSFRANFCLLKFTSSVKDLACGLEWRPLGYSCLDGLLVTLVLVSSPA